jgi:signal transduction histidine kinase/AraC-like DNA-binding protein
VGTGESGPTIAANNEAGVLTALQHLAEHGHQRIAFLAGTANDVRGDSGERLRAFEIGRERLSLDRDPRLVAYGRHVYDGGYSAVLQIIHSGADFTAVMASNDESALGAMQALKDNGRRVPEDVAVIGFDNRLEGSVTEPGLTSIHVPLFDVGYRAVALLTNAIREGNHLREREQVDAHLVVRESCGCRPGAHLPKSLPVPLNHSAEAHDRAPVGLLGLVASPILDQAHSLPQAEVLSMCEELIGAFLASIHEGSTEGFQKVLRDVLKRTSSDDDNLYMWHDAISQLEVAFRVESQELPGVVVAIDKIAGEARTLIGEAMQHLHLQRNIQARWISSRLSLLTARLLAALEETQIFDILATHLPDMGIHTAILARFEANDEGDEAWIAARDLLHPEQSVARVRSASFPAGILSDSGSPIILTLVPLVDQERQIGFMAFGSEDFDLYGSIVQQVGGALNTARLYRDATYGRKLAEDANRMKDRFLSTVSHELRTPLNLIIGHTGILLRDQDEGDSDLPDAVRQDIDRIHTYAQHLAGLIGDVIDLGSAEAGVLRLAKETTDFTAIVRMAATSGRQLAEDKGLAWEDDLPDRVVWVWGDPTRLRQVALNLISNAVKFTPSGRVCVRLEANDSEVTLTVKDTGPGVTEDELQLIFEEFGRSERTIVQRQGGLGLGLAISKRLAELHEGTITVSSTGQEGEGATFYFRLPVTAPPPEAALSPEQELPAPQTVALLTAYPQRHAELCERLSAQHMHVNVIRVAAGRTWLDSLLRYKPQAIILDVAEDSVEIWDVLKEIKAHRGFARTPIFFVSTRAEGAVLRLDYLSKPIEIGDLNRALDHYWTTPGERRHRRTILVVDDEPATLEMHARIARAHSSSNRILKARSGRQAIEVLRSEIVDLVLLDIQMPDLDGFQVLETMQSLESLRNIPVIVVTGQVLTEADMRRLNEGVAVVLSKGVFSTETTISQISSALEHRRKLTSESRNLTRLAMGYIHENYADSLTRGDIARHIGISEDHLTYCFRQELDTTPIAYLQRYRVNVAKHLLRETDRTITDIALSVGFSDSGYFSRIFRRETGMSPDSYRRS